MVIRNTKYLQRRRIDRVCGVGEGIMPTMVRRQSPLESPVAKLHADDGAVYEKARKKMENWFVLFVRTGSEKRVTELLRERLDASVYTPFVPTKAYPKIRKGKTETEIKICFPSYVFIRSYDTIKDFYEVVVPLALHISEVYYLLCYGGDKQDIVMRESECDYLKRLMNADFCMCESVGYEDNGGLHVTQGALVGMEESVVRIDGHKKLTAVKVVTMSEVKEITLLLKLRNCRAIS